jgi:hypothetical protein
MISFMISVVRPMIVAISVAHGRLSCRHRSLAVLGVGLGCLDTSPDHLAREPVFSSGSGS